MFAKIQSQLSGYGHASEIGQCYDAHAYSTPAVGGIWKWGRPLGVLGLREEAIHA